MRNGTIDLTCSPRPGTTEVQVGEVLRQILAHSNAAGNTGEFRIDRVPGGYHVVPVAIKGKSGRMEPDVSPLDTRISWPSREETANKLLERLAQAVTTGSGRTVTVGMFPMNMFTRAQVAVGAKDETARDVLWRALQAISPRLSWQLLCSVGENGMCALNIHAVPRI